jgi:phosphate/sulfate permease
VSRREGIIPLSVSLAQIALIQTGLAFFYGGMVKRKNVLSTIMQVIVTPFLRNDDYTHLTLSALRPLSSQSFICLSITTVVWIFVG